MKKTLLFLLAAVLLFLGSKAVPREGAFIGGLDVKESFFWTETFIKEQVLAGALPAWNPHYYSGHPFIANPNTAVFYPPTLLFVLLPLPWAFNADLVLHLFLAAAGMFLFARAFTRSTVPALAASAAYAFSGYFMMRAHAGHLTQIHSAALLPWVFYFAETAMSSRRVRLFAAAGLALGFQILSGDPQNSYYTLLFLLLYALLRTALAGPSTLREKATDLAAVLMVPFAAFGIAAVQVLPSLEFARQSDRSAGSYEFATHLSFPPENFFSFLLPRLPSPLVDVNWEFAGSVGAAGMMMALAGAAFFRHRRQVLPMILLLALTAALMLGEHTPLYGLFFRYLPGIALFRVPGRSVMMFTFFLALLAGLGTAAAGRGLQRRQLLLLTGAAAGALAIAAWGTLFLSRPLTHPAFLAPAGFILVATLLTALASLSDGRRSALLFTLMPLVIFFELHASFRHTVPRLEESALLSKLPHEKIVERDGGRYRVAFPVGLNRGTGHGYENVDALTPLVTQDYFDFLYGMGGLSGPEIMKGTLSHLYYRPEKVFSSKVLGVKYALVPADGGRYALLVNPDAMPRAVLVTRAVTIDGADGQRAFMKSKSFDPRREVVLSPEDGADGGGEAAGEVRGGVEILSYEAGRIRLKADCDRDCYLVLSELFYPGWTALVNGSKAPILRADSILRAVRLPAGSREVLFLFRPRSVYLGGLVSAAALLITLLFLARGQPLKTDS